MELTVIIPYRDERAALSRLLESLPAGLPAIVVDDCSEVLPDVERENTWLIRRATRGYFSGAVNTGIRACDTDVLVLNQDVRFDKGDGWLAEVAELGYRYACFGQGVDSHPAHPAGYVDGRFMYMRRDAIAQVGLLDERDWPLWGATCEWQLRAARAGFRVLPMPRLDWYTHERRGNFGQSIRRLLEREPEKRGLLVRTPPLVSVVISAYNYGRYLPDAIHSLIGGQTSLGLWPQQTFAGFEVIIVDDASTDETPEVMRKLANPWTGVRYVRMEKNVGTAAANNAGVRASFGQFVQVLCADDMLEPEALETSYRVVERNPCLVPYADISIFNDTGRVTTWKMREYDFDRLLEHNHVPAGIMFSREAWQAVGGYPEAFGQGREDWAMAVALGQAGYCGVRVPRPLYLYRRAGQNRSATNTTPKHRARFAEQMRATFPDLYGGKRTVACCGRRNPAPSSSGGGARESTPLLGSEGMVVLEYIGANDGKMTWYGPVTGARYLAGKSRPRIWVDKRDVPGLLAMMRDRRPVFRRAPEPVAQPEPVSVEPAAVQAKAAVISALSQVPAPPVRAAEIGDMTVAQVRAALARADAHTVQVWLQQEQAGKNRATVLKLLAGARGG